MRIGEETYPIYIGHGCLPELIQKVVDGAGYFDKIMLGFDSNTAVHCRPQLEAAMLLLNVPFESCVIGTTEENKTFQNLDEVLSSFLKAGVSRKSIVMPVGGGIVSNLYGLASALLFRGIRLVQCPTTFLNAHDAVTSQKQAVNHTGYKNIVGTFHLPTMVICDTAFFLTLGETEIKSGLGELTKNAALFGGEHYDLIKRTTMTHGPELSGAELAEATLLGIKAKDMLLCKDPKEKHLALLFEYGHTIGHALELTRGVCTSHGEGVTIGMLGASFCAEKMGLMTAADRAEHDAMVDVLQPQIEIPEDYTTGECLAEVLDKIFHDNKRGYLPERVGFVPMILAQRIGQLHKPNEMYLEYVPEEIVEQAVDYLLERFGPKTAVKNDHRRFSHTVSAEMVRATGSTRSRL